MPNADKIVAAVRRAARLAEMARPIVMPSFGMYTAEGTLVPWLKPPGAIVEAGEPVVEIETEKAVTEVAAPESGILHHVVEPGAIAPGRVAARLRARPGRTTAGSR